MKILKSTLLLLSIFYTILNTQSCKEACDDVVCQNGSICVYGTCDCPLGYVGINGEKVD